jgi:NAD(P)-dependent dehydrogenase (short-subunit alcohol dehydrogenase family)
MLLRAVEGVWELLLLGQLLRLELFSKVYCIDLLAEPHEGWYQVKQNLKTKGDNPIFKSQDVTNEEGIEKVFDEIVKREGRLDGLICAAVLSQLMSLTWEIIYIKDAILQSNEEFRKVLDTNVLGHLVCSRTFARHAVNIGTPGSIVLVASMSARIANDGLFSIGMNSSNAAIVQMARSMTCEWGSKGIRVNTLSPGYIASPLPKERYKKDPEGLNVIEQQNPVGRISEPADYRVAAVFMLSDASSFMAVILLLTAVCPLREIDLIVGHRGW